MRCTLDQLYERLLFTYPPEYRESRGGELMATAMELARPGQRVPSLREATGFIVGGLRTRARLARARPGIVSLADGLRLGAAMLVATALTGEMVSLLSGTSFHLLRLLIAITLPMAMGGALVILLRAPGRIGLLLILAAVGAVVAWDGMAWNAGYIPINETQFISAVVGSALPFVVAFAALLWQPAASRGNTRWSWSLVGLIALAPALATLAGVWSGFGQRSLSPLLNSSMAISVMLPLLLIPVALLTRDARLSMGVAVWAGVGLLGVLLGLVSVWAPASAAIDAAAGLIALIGSLAVCAVVNRGLARV